MSDNGVRRLETATKHLEKAGDISKNNKKLIMSFVQQISAEGIKRTRQVKYIYYLMRISRTLGKDLNEADRNDIIKVINDLENGHSLWIKRKDKPLSEWAKHDFKVTLKRFYRWLRLHEGQDLGLGENPKETNWFAVSMKREREKLPRQMLDDQDLEKLLEKTDNMRDRCFIFLLYESGFRIGEILAIKIEDVERDEHGYRITVHGKTGERVVRIIDAVVVLDNWLREHPKGDNKQSYLFCGLNGPGRGKEVGDNYFRKLLRKLGARAEIKKPLNPHAFRHSAATRYANTLTEAQLCQFMGWVIGSQESRTYVHLSGRDLDDAVLKMHGKKTKEEQKKKIEIKKKEPKPCPRCRTVNDHLANMCQVCGLGLDKKTIMDYDKQHELDNSPGFRNDPLTEQISRMDPDDLQHLAKMLAPFMQQTQTKKKNGA